MLRASLTVVAALRLTAQHPCSPSRLAVAAHTVVTGESDKGDDSEMRAVPGVDGLEPSRL